MCRQLLRLQLVRLVPRPDVQDAGWLSVNPTGGDSSGPGDIDTINVNYATTGLSEGTHNAIITISDPNATNNAQSVAVALTVTGSGIEYAPADFDQDGDVDLDDFAHLQACLSGSGVASTSAECLDARLDEGVDIDGGDLDAFLQCLSGADVTADPDCLD